MVELLVIILFLMLVLMWAAASIAALLIAIPVVLVIVFGQPFGLNWWQSLLAGLIVWAMAVNFVEAAYRSSYRKRAASLGLPADGLGREIEVEGKVVKIMGLAGRKVVVKHRKDLMGRRLDPNLVRTKMGVM